ncbi:EAL domain-containing protein [Chitinivorax sp. B]|uniref:EAL domain-containing protein n=1 Tax=Chitinivorax sp. B TaxID=2502235 RepID=UPI0010F8CCAE|nr:EAL domain-containing protein [Chitinivorax sp. B]
MKKGHKPHAGKRPVKGGRRAFGRRAGLLQAARFACRVDALGLTLSAWPYWFGGCRDGVVIWSGTAGYPVTYCNPAWRYRLGAQADELVRVAQGGLPGIVLDAESAKLLTEVLQSPRAATLQLSGHRPAGQHRRFKLTTWPLVAKSGQDHLVALIEDVTESLSREANLLRQVTHDAVTGLANRVLLLERLGWAMASAERYHHKCVLLMLDVDRFKHVNDAYGHPKGDDILRQVAERLRQLLRQEDLVARLGGDEFAIVLAEVESDTAARTVAERIRQALVPPFQLPPSRSIPLSASIGVAVFPDHGSTVEMLMQRADAAMYAAKALGGDAIEQAKGERSDAAARRLQIEAGLSQALERNELLLHFQPKVDLHTGEICGAEVLLRWQRADGSMVSPVEFITVAEESGLIEPIGEWLLGEACRVAARLRASELGPVRLAVNLSPRQFRSPHLASLLGQAMQAARIDASWLEVEVTESMAMQNPGLTRSMLAKIHELGVQIALDDFGTGHSSLAYLNEFPLDVLKIDQGFVRSIVDNVAHATMVRGIIALAHALSLRVVAEGIEQAAQLAYLRRCGCDMLQGYLFSKPISEGGFTDMLKAGKRLQLDTRHPQLMRALLLVDDEPFILQALQRVLRHEGYQIFTASSGAEALLIMAEHEVDVVLSDQRMPTMSGTDLLAKVKRIHPDTVRMILSAQCDFHAVRDAINRGEVFRFLSKPWEDDQLRAEIRRAFEYCRQRRDMAQPTMI